MRVLKTVLSFLFASGAAYAFSFAADFFFGQFAGSYDSTARIPVLTWSVTGAVCLLIALAFGTSRRVLAIPFVLFGSLAVFGGIVGHHFSLLVGAFLLAQAAAIGSSNRSRPSRWSSLPIRAPWLSIPSETLNNVTEFTSSEYAEFRRVFKVERSFHASPVTLFGHSWKVDLGTVNGLVFKVAMYLETPDASAASSITREIIGYCNQTLGPPAEESDGVSVWDTHDGNVVIQWGALAGTHFVNLFLTSGIVRTFTRK